MGERSLYNIRRIGHAHCLQVQPMDAFTHAMSFQKQSSTLVKMLCRDSSFLIAFLFATLSSFVLASPLPFANDGLAMTPAASANPAYPK